ncbi:MAG: hypothetical protein AABW56_02120 [Nanoarchaeota archaeon]
MNKVRQLTVKELSGLIKICKEYERPIDHVIRALSSHPENNWLLDASVSVITDTRISVIMHDNYLLDARFSGIRSNNIFLNSKYYRTCTIPFQDIPKGFVDKIDQRKIYSLLERTSEENLLFFKTA